MNKKIILLFFPPTINKFDFCDQEKIKFVDLTSIKKKVWQATDLNINELDKYLDLVNVKYQQKVNKTLDEENLTKLILVNYPRNLKHFQLIREEWSQYHQGVSHIILVNVVNYELILDIQKDYLICPLCEKIYWKTEVVKEERSFVCPRDKEYPLVLNEVIKFNELSTNYYLENNKKIVSKFLEGKTDSNYIIQLIVSDKEEIFSGEIQRKILEIIQNID